MKKLITVLWIIIFSLWGLSLWQEQNVPTKNSWLRNIFNTEINKIITPPSSNAMIEGTYAGIKGEKHKITDITEWWNKITSQEDATNRTIATIHRLINWALWLVALVALIVLIFWGIQMVTAAWDDWKFKSWQKALKKTAIWITWIAISRLIVSFIFRLIDLSTWAL